MKQCIVFLFALTIALTNARDVHAQPDLKVFTDVEAPANYENVEGEPVGTSVDIVREMLKRAGLEGTVTLMPWTRAYEHAKSNGNVMLFTAGKTKEREQLGFHFIGPVISRTHALYKRSGEKLDVESLEDIANKQIVVGGVLGDWRTDYLLSKGVNMDLSTGFDLNIRKIDANRYALIVSSDIEMPALLADENLPMDSFEMALVLKKAPSYIMLSNGTDKEILNRLDAAYEEMVESGFLDKVAEKYSNILGYELVFTPGKGLHRPAD
ncbi:substrate-binding periplasmic protein [Salidesulfovibrio brasiliensis]|uniref:substrate-binding periplasmic protein n=1 Tax=Salidesulfovibrio brasiliensis TaxID=221711 RepID=UPI0006D06C08|nr:transporter substrate-binding domain-containing protein [Salidesulfovibrio brasiliensis]